MATHMDEGLSSLIKLRETQCMPCSCRHISMTAINDLNSHHYLVLTCSSLSTISEQWHVHKKNPRVWYGHSYTSA